MSKKADQKSASVKNVLLVFDRYRRKFRTDFGAYPDNKYGRWVLACDICSKYPPINIAADDKIKCAFVEGDFDQVGDFLNVNGLEIVSYPLAVDFFVFAETPDGDSVVRKKTRSINSLFEGDD